MKLKDKCYTALMMLPALPFLAHAESGYGGLVIEDGSLQVSNPGSLADIMGVENSNSVLDSATRSANGMIDMTQILVGIGVLVAVGSMIFAGSQFAMAKSPQARENAKKRLAFTMVGVALLGCLGALISFSFNIFR